MHGRSGGGTHRESVDGLEKLPSSKVTSAFLQAVSDRPITGVLGNFGTQRADIRKSSDAMRPLNTRLIEHGCERLSEFVKEIESLKKGQFSAADLRAAGFMLQKVDAPSQLPRLRRRASEPWSRRRQNRAWRTSNWRSGPRPKIRPGGTRRQR